MALKVTHTAAETLNDILLHSLQQNGLEKTEFLEQSFFDQFNALASTDGVQDNGISTVAVNSYILIYKTKAPDTIVIAIIHSSRLPQTLKI